MRQARVLPVFDPTKSIGEIQWELLGWEPTAEQRPILECRKRQILVAGGEQAGKALRLDTPLPTPQGWRTIGDLVTGDEVFDESGAICRVKGTATWFDRPCWRVSFDDGTSIVADENHEWLTECSLKRRSRLRQEHKGQKAFWDRAQVRTTLDIANTLYSRGGEEAEHSNHSIRLNGPLAYASAVLPLDPYVFGAWLGDGNSSAANFTCADTEILAEFGRRGVRSEFKGKYLYFLGEKQGQRRVLNWVLRGLGVLNNKHIPPIYLQASVEQRWDLLRGLMDTDGTADLQGHCEFFNKNPRVIAGMSELLTSLGIKHQTRQKVATLYGKPCGEAYTVSFVASKPVFLLPRKRERQCPEGLRPIRDERKRKYIVGTEQVGAGTTRCIEVDSTSHLYLVGRGMIPTHNSIVAAKYLLQMIPEAPEGALFWLVAADYERTRREFGYLVEDLERLHLLVRCSKRVDPGFIEIGSEGTKIETKSANDPRTLAMYAPQGIVICEASQVDLETYWKCRLRVAPTRGWLFMSGSFESSLGWFPALFTDWKMGYGDGKSFSLPSWSNIHLYPGGRKDPEILRMEREASDTFFMERMAGIPRPPRGLVFPEFSVEYHVQGVEWERKVPVQIAVDPGYAGYYAVLAIQVVDGQVRVFDEIYQKGLVTEDIISICGARPWAREWGKTVVGGAIDVAGYQHQAMAAPAEVWLARTGLALKAEKVRVADGTERLKAMLKLDPLEKRPRLVVSSRCKGLLSEFGAAPNPDDGQLRAYQWKTDRDGNIVGEEPDDKNNHALKALIYWMVSEFGYVMGTTRQFAQVRKH